MVIIYVSAASAVVIILLLIICVFSGAYYYRCFKKEFEVVEKKEVAIEISEGANGANPLNNTTAAVLPTPPTAIEMQEEVTGSGSNDSADISEQALKATKQNPVAIADKPYQEASTVLSEERSYLEEADDCESCQNNNMEGGGKPPADTHDFMSEQTLSSDDEQPPPFVPPQQVSNCQTKSTDKMDNGLELEAITNYSSQLKELEPD